VYYQPVDRGLEIKLKEKLDRLRDQRRAVRSPWVDGEPGT